VIQHAIEQTFRAYNLDLENIAGIATIDLKANEPGLLTYCQTRSLPLQTYSAERLNTTIVPHPSQIVATSIQTSSVAEAAALLAAKTDRLCVTKQVFRLDGESGVVTIAVGSEN
jgi:cobalt-precorrin 5A hydrolase/precorrin-3B C17-methyltransferase